MKPIDSTDVELSQLISLFYTEDKQERWLGLFEECSVEHLPVEYRQLLAHEHHMTVTVEDFHHSPVELQVLASRHDGSFYSRKIVLKRKSDSRAVLFGIVRIDLNVLEPEVREAIEAKQLPLGQVLINHDVLRKVKLVNLYRIQPGRELETVFSPSADPLESVATDLEKSSDEETGNKQKKLVDESRALFGRTALIYCDNRPVIELLEIVAS